MSGLGKAVHIKLQEYIDKLLLRFEQVGVLVDDRIKVEELFQSRTVIFYNGSYYLCITTDVDYTESVHGPDGNESEPLRIQLPPATITQIMLHHVPCMDLDREQLKSKLEVYEGESYGESNY